MPEITIEQSTFERLQKHAKPFVDSPDTVIMRALDALDLVAVENSPANGEGVQPERLVDYRALPNLTHTKVLDAAIDAERIARPNWNSLLDAMLCRAMRRAGDFDGLRQLCPVNMVRGRKEDEGYSYLAEIDVSVQGQDANGACRTVVAASQALGIGLDIGFMWRLKQAAAFPGERARIRMRAVTGEHADRTETSAGAPEATAH